MRNRRYQTATSSTKSIVIIVAVSTCLKIAQRKKVLLSGQLASKATQTSANKRTTSACSDSMKRTNVTKGRESSNATLQIRRRGTTTSRTQTSQQSEALSTVGTVRTANGMNLGSRASARSWTHTPQRSRTRHR